MTVELRGTGTRLTHDDFALEAVRFGVQPPLVVAVVDVEASGSGFISASDPRMKILYEAHLFSSRTGHRYDETHPNISSRAWNRSLYGAGGAHQYARLAEAMSLNEDAALQSCSWGLGQVLGQNWQMLDFKSVYDMVETLRQGERQQLDAMLTFCKKSGAMGCLQRLDFDGFTRIYNGPGQIDLYSGRLRGAYQKALQEWTDARPTGAPRVEPEAWNGVLVKGITNDARVAAAQRALQRTGFYKVPPLAIDGDFGPGTEFAVMQFQSANKLTRDGVVGRMTATALGLV